ncbi:MAG: ATP-dependent sacrificial sulfur transferase LarE [Lachnospiraceae bacterium]|nr:ATP-dependent sacrificial sulfur transferase LarE [Lachnospiraceae bacterium]
MKEKPVSRNELFVKYDALKERLRLLGKAAVAFSGGVDSTFLLYAAHEALGENVMAVTAKSCLFPEKETSEAEDYCSELGIKHLILPVDILSDEDIADNPANRCYLCKKKIFGAFLDIARQEGFSSLVEGSNLDDDNDYRPGRQAVRELGVLSPLKDAGLSKAGIRELSEAFGLPTADKPSFACLASRLPYGEKINEKKLKMIDSAEQYLRSLGFGQLRVRMHGDSARIELIPEDFDRFMQNDLRLMVHDRLKHLGFSYISLDLMGYRTGSMNETL